MAELFRLVNYYNLPRYLGVHGPAMTCLLSMSELVRTAHPSQDWLVLGGGQTVADAAAKVLPKAGFAMVSHKICTNGVWWCVNKRLKVEHND